MFEQDCEGKFMSPQSSPTTEFPEGFKIIEGRKFSEKINYLLPIDESEIRRLDFQHYIMWQLMHGNFSAPVEELLEEGIKVLDVGCGTGCWVIEMARDFPNSTFIGVDFSNIFPSPDEIPSNASFIEGNTLNRLPFADDTFDYVYQRYGHIFILSVNEVATFNIDKIFIQIHADVLYAKAVALRELARVAKPGGWVEMFEMDTKELERPPENLMSIWTVLNKCATEAFGLDPHYVWQIANMLKENGFEDVELDYISIPLGWGGRIGELNARNLLTAWLAIGPKVAPVLNIGIKEYTELAHSTMSHMKLNKSWHKAPYAFGRKPLRKRY
ncbi:LOW QUALITY PROTEIN: S-adenosyl-L-methionine-dependent methyltransferase [Endogone sp. FLAS-F59071]|nr:LOW QUALITY PROTEIN: S-adenosyl-L-methionine-dependent methyltransferase [Endogone sp. FLAS-F59071]|eukprot:RUS21717.1 LOW QUALITY PROTEIN: S-adenosyl-L-methionine-dependent methyltransferase [Endogone sp. FLAS-F59071]